jgi:hypothetical protein
VCLWSKRLWWGWKEYCRTLLLNVAWRSVKSGCGVGIVRIYFDVEWMTKERKNVRREISVL